MTHLKLVAPMAPLELPIANVEAEQLILGAFLIHNDALMQAAGLRSEQFHEPIHQAIFQAILDCRAKGMVASPITLNLPDFQDSKEYMMGIAGSVGMVPVADLVFTVQQSHQKREILSVLRQAAQTLGDAQETAEEFAANVSSGMQRIVSTGVEHRFENEYDVGEKILASLKDNRRPFSTGLPKLDEAMGGGLYPGKSYGFAARKKVGKTVLASTISWNLSQHGTKHLFICGEMSPEEIHQRNLSRALKVDPAVFRLDHGKSRQFQNRLAEEVINSKRNIIYRNAPGLTFDALQQMLSIAVTKYRIKGFILDYWQLVGGKRKGQSSSEHLDEVAQWISDFSRKNGVWSITMAQINQEGNTRGGEGIRLAFDQVYQINREDITAGATWIEMMDTRYTPWTNIGSKDSPGLTMQPQGPYFDQF